MRIGILGAGMIGGTLGRLWHRAGHELFFGTRHPDRVKPLVEELGEDAASGTAEEAARFGEVVLLAVPLIAIPELGRALGETLTGKVVIDATNAYVQRDGASARAASATPGGSSAWVAAHFPGARLVKAFNTVYFKTLASQAHLGGDPLGIPMAGDDPGAVSVVQELIQQAGFEPVPAGPLARGRDFEPGTSPYNSGMRASVLRRELAATA